jgi:hypothetical protein
MKVYPSSECLELLKKMLAYNPDERFSIDEVLKSSWFVSMHYKL